MNGYHQLVPDVPAKGVCGEVGSGALACSVVHRR